MPPQAQIPSIDARAARTLRRRSLANLARMGHCAPTVMQTLLDASVTEAAWLVKMTAGLPGGIGNTGGECGGITAPLVLLGLRHARDSLRDGVPITIYKGHDLLRRFTACHGTALCREIRGDDRLPLRCIGVIRHAPEQYVETLSTDCGDAISGERQEAYRLLHAQYVDREFHCAHAVLGHLRQTVNVSQELLDGASGFVGGTVFTGSTCSAFTAGVMALGVALGEIEDSRLRVLRMIGTMAIGGDAFADARNAFNRVMNLGHRLSRWFTSEYGSTECRALTQCDFSTTAGVRQYIEADHVSQCSAMAQAVARQVRGMIAACPRQPSDDRSQG